MCVCARKAGPVWGLNYQTPVPRKLHLTDYNTLPSRFTDRENEREKHCEMQNETMCSTSLLNFKLFSETCQRLYALRFIWGFTSLGLGLIRRCSQVTSKFQIYMRFHNLYRLNLNMDLEIISAVCVLF